MRAILVQTACTLALLTACDDGSDTPPDTTTTNTVALEHAAPLPALWLHNGTSSTLQGEFSSACERVTLNALGEVDSRWQLSLDDTTVRVEQQTFSSDAGTCQGNAAASAQYTLIVHGIELTTLAAVMSPGMPIVQNAAGSAPLSASGLVNTLDVQVVSRYLALPLDSRGEITLLVDDSIPTTPRIYMDFHGGIGGFSPELTLLSFADFAL